MSTIILKSQNKHYGKFLVAGLCIALVAMLLSYSNPVDADSRCGRMHRALVTAGAGCKGAFTNVKSLWTQKDSWVMMKKGVSEALSNYSWAKFKSHDPYLLNTGLALGLNVAYGVTGDETLLVLASVSIENPLRGFQLAYAVTYPGVTDIMGNVVYEAGRSAAGTLARELVAVGIAKTAGAGIPVAIGVAAGYMTPEEGARRFVIVGPIATLGTAAGDFLSLDPMLKATAAAKKAGQVDIGYAVVAGQQYVDAINLDIAKDNSLAFFGSRFIYMVGPITATWTGLGLISQSNFTARADETAMSAGLRAISYAGPYACKTIIGGDLGEFCGEYKHELSLWPGQTISMIYDFAINYEPSNGGVRGANTTPVMLSIMPSSMPSDMPSLMPTNSGTLF